MKKFPFSRKTFVVKKDEQNPCFRSLEAKHGFYSLSWLTSGSITLGYLVHLSLIVVEFINVVPKSQYNTHCMQLFIKYKQGTNCQRGFLIKK